MKIKGEKLLLEGKILNLEDLRKMSKPLQGKTNQEEKPGKSDARQPKSSRTEKRTSSRRNLLQNFQDGPPISEYFTPPREINSTNKKTRKGDKILSASFKRKTIYINRT